MSLQRYDTIGINYSALRKPDPRIAGLIHQALGTAGAVLNVGAGTGSYEPTDRSVTAVEPSSQMIRQRPKSAARAIQASSENLPFEDNAFDASMAILTVHHWADKNQGLQEMRRVTTGPIVLLSAEPSFKDFWLSHYIPEFVALEESQMPTMSDLEQSLGPIDVTPVLIPHDCVDGFFSAYWRRPGAYLDDKIRAVMSPFWLMGDVSAQLQTLRDDLDSGQWARKYGHLLELDALDCGYRLVVTR